VERVHHERQHRRRREAHVQFLRRHGAKREHIHHYSSPDGDFAVVVWEGVEQDRIGELVGGALRNPQSDHERYMGEYVVPELHGIDLTAPPSGALARVAVIET
jgi:hypothetical protein